MSMREAIALHLQGLREDGDPIPPPSTVATAYVEVDAARRLRRRPRWTPHAVGSRPALAQVPALQVVKES